MKTGDAIVMRAVSGHHFVARFAPVVDIDTCNELNALDEAAAGSPYEFVGVIRDARDVPPYTGPSGWRDVAERRCACGHHEFEHHRPRDVREECGHLDCYCPEFRNAAVARMEKRG